MATYVALARGINVGGRHSVPMAELRKLCEDLGFTEVETYIQSGNVVLDDRRSAAEVERVLATALARAFPFEIPIMVRTPAELRAVQDDTPFPDADPAHLHVMFLDRGPALERRELDRDRSPGDRAIVSGHEIYLHLPGGVGRTKLTGPWLEKQAGRPGTIRNWRTLGKLAAGRG